MTAIAQNDNTSSGRDFQLDNYRALVMIYILCVIHVAYWLGALSEPLRSIILFEMPVIFFISGAALNVSKKRRSLIAVTSNRAKRVLAPYYVYALVCIVVFTLHYYFIDTNNDSLTRVYLNALYPRDNSVPIPYAYHLWFVIPYLIVCCTFCFQQKITDKINPYLYLITLLVTCIIAQIVTNNNIIRSVVFYNFFFMAGYLLYKRISHKVIILITITTIPIFVTLFLISGGGVMQRHKFPPDILFLSFGVLALSTLSLIFSRIRIPQTKILRLWNKSGYTIYLWQNVAFIIASLSLAYIPASINSGIAGFFIKATFIFIISTLIGIIAAPFEKIIIDNASKLFKRFTAQLIRLIPIQHK